MREVTLPEDSLKLLSFNIQAGIGTSRFREYLTGSWKHLVAHPRSVETIEQIAEVVRHFDVVGLQEVDGGSLRSRNVNQLVHLASMADFPFWHQQLNRNLGRLGQFSNGFLSRLTPFAVEDHTLPGLPGRGAILIKFGHPIQPLVVAVVHLALGEKMRNTQLGYVSRLLRPYRYTVVMGTSIAGWSTWLSRPWRSSTWCPWKASCSPSPAGPRTGTSTTSCVRRSWKCATPACSPTAGSPITCPWPRKSASPTRCARPPWNTACP